MCTNIAQFPCWAHWDSVGVECVAWLVVCWLVPTTKTHTHSIRLSALHKPEFRIAWEACACKTKQLEIETLQPNLQMPFHSEIDEGAQVGRAGLVESHGKALELMGMFCFLIEIGLGNDF